MVNVQYIYVIYILKFYYYHKWIGSVTQHIQTNVIDHLSLIWIQIIIFHLRLNLLTLC